MSHSRLAQLQATHKKFGQIKALDGMDLSVQRGELLALLGPNGAGKSTAIAMLLGLQRPDTGSATLFELDPQDLDARRRIGVMMQEVALSPVMHPRELITQVASYYPTPYEPDAVIKRLSLESLADRPYGKLSGGQKRQVQFAMAICGRPELLFLDEPSVGLDIQAREAMWRVVRELIHEGCSIVLTTHYLEEAEALAHRVAVMARGKVIASGSVDEIRAHVSRKQISCITDIPHAVMRAWPEVTQFEVDRDRIRITARDAEAVLVRLFTEDPTLQDIEVKRAGLAEAFSEITSTDSAAQKETVQ